MPEPLNAPTASAPSRAAQTATTSAKDRERRHQASAVTPRIPPSQCPLCVPLFRIVEDSYYLTVSQSAHESACKNHPAQRNA